jgi:hypothetical protein
MELKLGLQDLLRLIMQLAATERTKLKSLLSRTSARPVSNTDMEELLLSGPTFSAAQLKKVDKAREAVSAWQRHFATAYRSPH